MTRAANDSRLAGVGQRDDRAAESAARHARRDGAVLVGEFDEQVELGSGDLEVVAKARVPLAEQCAERLPVRPAGDSSRRTQARTRSFSETTCRSRRRATSSTPAARAASSAASTVTSDGRAPPRAGSARSSSARRVAYPECSSWCRTPESKTTIGEALGERDEPVLLGGAVEEECVAAPSEQRDRRVHQPHGYADRPVLRLLGHAAKLESR